MKVLIADDSRTDLLLARLFVENWGHEVVTVEDVWPGEVFVGRPGDRIPLDGVVGEGTSEVNQATITGESAPAVKDLGDDVYAGTINIDGFLAVKVT